MKEHERINKLLEDFALGELSQQKETEVKTHLAECPQCSSELKRLETLLECTERIRELSADKQMCESAKQAVLEALKSKGTEQPTPKSNIGLEFIWKTIMKSWITKLVTASLIIGFFGLFVFLGNGQATLYAQVIKALENTRTFHVLNKHYHEGQWHPGLEVWYEAGVGVVEITKYLAGKHKGQTEVRIDNTKYEWKYFSSDNYATRSRSGYLQDMIKRFFEGYTALLKCNPVRNAPGDEAINGVKCQMYVTLSKDKKWQSNYWIDSKNLIRRYEGLHLADDGQWVKYDVATVEYDIEIDQSRFSANFGPNVRIIDAVQLLDDKFSLDNALYKERVMDLIYAVHELKRCEDDQVYVVSSLRPSKQLLEELGPIYSAGWGNKVYGDFLFDTWPWPQYKARANGARTFYYHHHYLAVLYNDGLFAKWYVLKKTGPGPERAGEVNLVANIYARVELQKKRELQNLNRYEQVIVKLPMPEEQLSLVEVAEKIYSDIELLESAAHTAVLNLKLPPEADESSTPWKRTSQITKNNFVSEVQEEFEHKNKN